MPLVLSLVMQHMVFIFSLWRGFMDGLDGVSSGNCLLEIESFFFFFSFPFWLWTHQSCVMVGFAFDFGRLWSCLIDPHKGFMSTTSNKWLALLSHECTEECVKAFQLPLWSLQEDGGRCFLSLMGTKKQEWNCYCLVKQLLLGMLRVNLIKLCPLGLLPSQVRVDSNAIFIFSRILPFSTAKSLSPINWPTF